VGGTQSSRVEAKRGKGKEGEKENEKELPSRPSATLTTSPSSGSSSFFNVSNAHNLLSQQETNGATAGTSAEAQSPPKAKILPPIPRDFAATTPRATSPAPATPLPTGEVDKDVFETMGASTLSARFEINIVKVPWLPLHGIQFRRASGDGWQYQMLARRVLTELKL